MIAGKLIDLVLQLLGKNDQDFPVGGQEVAAEIEALIASILASYVRNGQQIPDGFYKVYEVPVDYNERRKRHFAYPEGPRFVSLSENMGVKNVGPTEDEFTSYIELKSGQLSSTAGLEVQALGGKTGYWVEGSVIQLHSLPIGTDFVNVRMIPRFSEVDEDEEIFATDEVEAVVIDGAYKRWAPKAQNFQEDKSNDNKKS